MSAEPMFEYNPKREAATKTLPLLCMVCLETQSPPADTTSTNA